MTEVHLHADDGVDEEEHRDEQNDVRQRLQQQPGRQHAATTSVPSLTAKLKLLRFLFVNYN